MNFVRLADQAILVHIFRDGHVHIRVDIDHQLRSDMRYAKPLWLHGGHCREPLNRSRYICTHSLIVYNDGPIVNILSEFENLEGDKSTVF